MYREIILGIMLFFMARLLYLYIAGWVCGGEPRKLMRALRALWYLFLASLALYFRYQGNFWEKATEFSFANWKDIVFLVMYAIPIALTVADVVLARKYDKKEKNKEDSKYTE